MDTQDLKKILATISIAGLLTASIPLTANCSSHEENDKKDVQTEEVTEEEKGKAEETDAPASADAEGSGAASTQSDEASSTGS